MKVRCPHCGKPVMVNHLGRKPLELPVIKVYNSLRHHQSVAMAASELCCSRAYIYKVLKAEGLTPVEVIKGKVTKKNLYPCQGKDIDIIS